MSLNNRVIFITGASRGIGREMALKFANEGARLVIAAKSDTPHPKLEGTIHSVVDEIKALGGEALAIKLDVREDDQIESAIKQTLDHFGQLDAVINNAGAIKLLPSEHLPMKRFDLMMQINTRAVLSLSKAALPALKRSENGHIINLSPPLNLAPKWFKNFGPYTVTKYGMSMLTISMAEEYKRYGISVNSLWPKTVISTAAVEFESGNASTVKMGRHPKIMADAAFEIIKTEKQGLSGELLIDEELLLSRGYQDLDGYRFDPSYDKTLMTDLFVEN